MTNHNIGQHSFCLMHLIDMNAFKNLYRRARLNKKSLIVSAINAFVVFILCYTIDNLPYSFVGDATLGQRFDQVKQFVSSKDEDIPSDLLLINVAYDRELVDVTDDFGFPKGNIDITNRSKLLELLTRLNNSHYKYIVLDVSFSNEHKTEQDSALFNLIHKMKRIVVAKSEKIETADSILLDKARYSDYSTHISESNFVKYEYIRNGEPTLPYQIYLDLGGDEIHSFAGLYFFKGRLANKSIVLRYPIKIWNKYVLNSSSKIMAEPQYYNLGSDILDTDIDTSSLTKDKIVVIGDFSENDIHDTYIGKIAGPIINLNAFYALTNDNLSIPYAEIFFLLLLYFTISLFIMKEVSVNSLFPFVKKIKSKTFDFLLSFIGLSFSLSGISLLWYTLFDLDINILIPSLYFSIFGTIIKYRKTITL